MSDNLEIRRTTFDSDEELQQLVKLQNKVYEQRGLTFRVESFRHWYKRNPQGDVLAFGAFDGSDMVAHYACVPIQMTIDQKPSNGLLSMAVVTHPDYRGRGLFRTLAAKTYELGTELGYEFVVGVANANSFPGFMKYFPFTFIGKLDVKWGWGPITLPQKQFMRSWNAETLRWRAGNKGYSQKGNAIFGKYRNIPFFKTFVGIVEPELLKTLNLPTANCTKTPLTLYVGLGADLTKGHYFNFPKFVKHSPFNLRFMDLTPDKHLPAVNSQNIVFQLIDFDVA